MFTASEIEERPGTVLVIIGAPRSGTNLLRDVLTDLPGFGTWPCDEINLIWRHGNSGHATDEICPDQATREVKLYIRRAFNRLARKLDIPCVVEKTCANSLRVAFVDRVLPDARFIFIVRDGRDAAASAMRRWKAPFEFRYTMKKLRFVPLADIPCYGTRFIANRYHRLLSRDRRVRTWGPVFEGLSETLEHGGLAAACGAQWARCVEAAERDLANLSSDRVFQLQYEEFVGSPAAHVERLLCHLEMHATSADIERAAKRVESCHVGKWRRQLNGDQLQAILRHAAPTLRRHGYIR